jgi:hypothetical protein
LGNLGKYFSIDEFKIDNSLSMLNGGNNLFKLITNWKKLFQIIESKINFDFSFFNFLYVNMKKLKVFNTNFEEFFYWPEQVKVKTMKEIIQKKFE